MVEIWTDGSVSRQHGPGGWAAVLRFGGREKQLFGKEPETANQRQELLAWLIDPAPLTQRDLGIPSEAGEGA